MTQIQPDTPLFKSWEDAGQNIFVPEHYAMQDEAALYAFIAANPVGQVFSSYNNNMQVTSAPFIRTQRLDADTPLLAGHIAARNPQCEAIIACAPAVITFSTGGAYISPRWFCQNITAPTWSYVSVQVRGRFLPLTEDETALDILERTVAHMEALTPCQDGERPWSMAALAEEQIERYVTMVRGFHFEVEAIEGICRLNQEKDRADMKGIINGLSGQPASTAQHIIQLMKANLDFVDRA